MQKNRIYRCYLGMLPYVKPYTFKAIVALTLCIPIGALDAVIAISLKPYTDLVMVEKSLQAVWYVPFIIILFSVIQGGLIYLATYLTSFVGEKITRDIKYELYCKLLNLDSSYFDKTKSGDVIFRFNTQVDTASSQLFSKIKLIISRFFASISLICVLIYNSWQLSIIALLVMSCAFIPISKIRKKIHATMHGIVDNSANLVTEYSESYAGNKTIMAYNLYDYQQTKFLGLIDKITMMRIKLARKTALLSPIMHFIIAIGIGITIAYGSFLIVSEKITSGNFVSFLTALIMLYNPVKNFGNNVKEFQLSLFATEQVLDLLRLETKIKEVSNPVTLKTFENEIEFNNVKFGYDSDKIVINSLNLTIKKGEKVAFVGNSGSGKSTIASLLPRFYDINFGCIKIDGIDIRDYSLKSLRENISIVLQDNFLFSGTIKDNILLRNKDASDDELNLAIKMAYLEEFIKNLKHGIDTQIGERGILLSGGQKQRIAIARAFLKNSPILILDEATSALDNQSESIVQKAIENLMKDKTVLVIAHRLSTIRNASKIAVIDNGKVIECGTHDNLMQNPLSQYRKLYECQFKKQ